MRLGTKVVAAAVVAAVLWLPASASAAPANDHFADRQDLGEALPRVVSGSNVAATKEDESIGSFAAGHSVWFKWKAPATGFVTIGACGGNFTAVLGVFTGTTLGSLVKVVSGNAAEGPHCRFAEREYTFKATADTTYVIAVDGNAMSLPGGPPPLTEGQIELRIEATPPPVNDDFADATTLLGSITEEPGGRRFYFSDVSGYSWGADKEPLEPDHGGDQGGASVWYSWTAPATGSAQVGVCCGSFYLLGVYVGSSVGSLTPLKLSAFGTLPVVAGTTYRLAVDGAYDLLDDAARTGSFNLRASMELPSADPLPVPLPSGSATGSGAISGPKDSTAPRTTLGSRKVRSSARTASFGFRADEAVAGFRCRLDAGKVTSCRSPKTYSGLAPGRHVFRVYAVDRAGNADATPAIARFAIAPPTRKPGHRAGD
jgi:hypothetical protein